MKLELRRIEAHLGFTIGALYIDGHYFCYTLEDQVRPPSIKIPGETCIPSGSYQVILDHSTRFNRIMPHVLNVNGFEGIRIHAGNTSADTSGCILVGMGRGKIGEGVIYRSREAFDLLFSLLKDALDRREFVSLVITDEFGQWSDKG